jgi:hypothetical protein
MQVVFIEGMTRWKEVEVEDEEMLRSREVSLSE